MINEIDYLFAEAVSEISLLASELFNSFDYEFDSRTLNQRIAEEAHRFLQENTEFEGDYIDRITEHYKNTIQAEFKPLLITLEQATCRLYTEWYGSDDSMALAMLSRESYCVDSYGDIREMLEEHGRKYNLSRING